MRTLALALVLCAVPARPQGAVPPPAALPLPACALERAPGLADQSTWGLEPAHGARAGAARWLIGDGRLLAACGGGLLGAPELRALDGSPAHRLRGTLCAAGRPVLLQHRLRRARPGSVLVGSDTGACGLAVHWTGFVHDGAWQAVLEVANHGAAARERTALALALGDVRIGLPCGDLPPGGRWTAAVRARGRPAAVARADVDDVLAALVRHLHEEPRPHLRLDADAPALPDFARDATAALLACHARGIGPVDAAAGTFAPRAATGPLLVYLRCGRYELARELLRSEHAMVRAAGRVDASVPVAELRRAGLPPAPPAGWDGVAVGDVETACWIVLHHYWYLRAARETATIRAHWPLLEACVEGPSRAAAGPRDGAPFATAVLFLHAVAALGGLHDLLAVLDGDAGGAPRPGARTATAARWRQRALGLLADLEQRYWQPAAGCFAPWPLAGGTGAGGAATGPAAAANLLPCWIGMLATTGDKTLRNAHTALAVLGRGGDRVADRAGAGATSPFAQALGLAALAQFEGAEREAALARLLAMASPAATFERPGGGLDLLATGAAVDAALFAVTGHRVANGPGVDERWLRCRPALPPGCRRFACRGMRQDGHELDLWVDRLEGSADGPARTRFALVLRSRPEGGAPLAVVHSEGQQFQARLEPDRAMTGTPAVSPGARLLGPR